MNCFLLVKKLGIQSKTEGPRFKGESFRRSNLCRTLSKAFKKHENRASTGMFRSRLELMSFMNSIMGHKINIAKTMLTRSEKVHGQ